MGIDDISSKDARPCVSTSKKKAVRFNEQKKRP